MSDQDIRIVVMRLADMDRHHPREIIAACSTCGAAVAVYPSGQGALKARPDAMLVCSVCALADPGVFDPNNQHTLAAPFDQIAQEIRESVRRQ
jgi:hypothetical protein